MAIVISKITADTVKIVKDSLKPKFYIRQTDTIIQVPNQDTISIYFGNGGSLILPYTSIGTINGSVKPVTIEETAELLATDIF